MLSLASRLQPLSSFPLALSSRHARCPLKGSSLLDEPSTAFRLEVEFRSRNEPLSVDPSLASPPSLPLLRFPTPRRPLSFQPRPTRSLRKQWPNASLSTFPSSLRPPRPRAFLSPAHRSNSRARDRSRRRQLPHRLSSSSTTQRLAS